VPGRFDVLHEIAAWLPRLFTPIVRYGIDAMLHDSMIAAFCYVTGVRFA
jgi:hypothetical protein